MSSKFKVAMIGAGRMANSVHYPSLASFEDVEIAAICDLSLKALNETADKYHVAGRYDDYRKMVQEVKPDAVYVIGQPHLMFDIWMWCLQQGLHLYIEKPLGITIHQARMLAYTAEKKQLHHPGQLSAPQYTHGDEAEGGMLEARTDHPCGLQVL